MSRAFYCYTSSSSIRHYFLSHIALYISSKYCFKFMLLQRNEDILVIAKKIITKLYKQLCAQRSLVIDDDGLSYFVCILIPTLYSWLHD